jgi:hypothetical protein
MNEQKRSLRKREGATGAAGTKRRQRIWAGTILAPIVALGLAGCSGAAPVGAVRQLDDAAITEPVAGTQSKTFTYTGYAEQWPVPDGVTSVSFQISGGRGGHAADEIVSWGGSAAVIIGSVPVTPGQVLSIALGGEGGFGAGGWGYSGMSGGPANTAKNKDRSGGAGGGASMIALANADGSDWHLVVVAGGGGGQGGGSSDPAGAGLGGNAGCSKLGFYAGSAECSTPSVTGGDGQHGSVGPLGGSGGKAGGAGAGVGERGHGAKNLGGNGGSGGGGLFGGAAGGGASGISAGGGGGAGTSYIDDTVVGGQISANDYNVQFTYKAYDDPTAILSW